MGRYSIIIGGLEQHGQIGMHLLSMVMAVNVGSIIDLFCSKYCLSLCITQPFISV